MFYLMTRNGEPQRERLAAICSMRRLLSLGEGDTRAQQDSKTKILLLTNPLVQEKKSLRAHKEQCVSSGNLPD